MTLEEQIKYHNNLYWKLNKPEISDEDYDKLLQELYLIDPNNELFNHIGQPHINSKIITHPNPMLSLDKAYTKDELYNWAKKISRNNKELFEIMPKYDGWACRYDGKNLVTRGDGIVGEILNHKIQQILLHSQNYTGPLKDYNNPILGELILSKNEFEDKLKNKYKTPRSALAGILSSHDLIHENVIIDLIDYDIEIFEADFKSFQLLDIKELLDDLKNWNYHVDGLVIRLKDKEYSKSLGNTSHHPRGAIAFKDKNPMAKTKIKDIEWFVGKDGRITPVAILKPVDILGHTIQKASLHNYNIFENFNIGYNDEVIIERCGEIIPQIVRVINSNSNNKISSIKNCPICNANIAIHGLFMYCNNPECEGKLSKQLVDAYKRLGLENIGPGIVNKLIDNKVINNMMDIFKIKYEDLVDIEGFQDKSINNLLNEVKRVKENNIEDWKILSCLNINNIGITISKKLLKEYTLDELIKMDINKLSNIDLIGPIRAKLLYDGLMDNIEILDEFIEEFKVINSKSNIKNKTVCFTGKMDKPRNYYEDLSIKMGYLPVNSINKDLDLLVTTEIDRKSSKMDKAKKLGIKIITLEDFLKL